MSEGGIAHAFPDQDPTNGFGIALSKLCFDRFRGKVFDLDSEAEGDLAPHLHDLQQACEALKCVCEEAGHLYLDADGCDLELQDAVPYLQIQTHIRSEEESKKLVVMCMHLEENLRDQRTELACILGRVHSWRRPHQVLSHPVLFAPGNTLLRYRPPTAPLTKNTVTTLVKFADTSIFNDSYFLAAVGLVSLNRNAFSRIFASLEYSQCGVYCFQFYSTKADDLHKPGWVGITVDTLLPLDAKGQLCFGALSEGETAHQELWLCLMEKAYAKLLGSYSLLHYGDTADTFVHLTGGAVALDRWDAASVLEEDKYVLWWKIRENCRNGLMTALCDIPITTDELHPETSILTYTHERPAYRWNETTIVVITTVEIPNKKYGYTHVERLAKVRTLYGKTDWVGDWHNGSRGWNRDNRAHCGYPWEGEDESITWVSLADLARHYNIMLTGSRFHGAPLTFYKYLEPQKDGHAPFHALQYVICIEDPRDVRVQMEEAEKGKKQANFSMLGTLKDDDSDLDLPEDSDDEGKKAEESFASSMRSLEERERMTHSTSQDPTKFSFERLKQTVQTSMAGTKTRDENKQKYTLRITLTQPSRVVKGFQASVKEASPREATVNLFQGFGEHLQPCSYIDPETGGAQKSVSDAVHYAFPTNTRLELQEVRSEDKSGQVFQYPVRPGFYIITIHQADHRYGLHYNLRVDAEDDEFFPSGYRMRVIEGGSCATPKLDNPMKPRTVKNTRRKFRA